MLRASPTRSESKTTPLANNQPPADLQTGDQSMQKNSASEVVETAESEKARYANLQQIALDFARNGETAQLAKMLEYGLTPNLCDLKGNSLLMLASYNGNEEITQMLLEKNAEVDLLNDRGQTPLGGAVFKGFKKIVALLLDHGADIDADNGGGATPLMFAQMFGRNEIAELLIERGAKK